MTLGSSHSGLTLSASALGIFCWPAWQSLKMMWGAFCSFPLAEGHDGHTAEGPDPGKFLSFLCLGWRHQEPLGQQELRWEEFLGSNVYPQELLIYHTICLGHPGPPATRDLSLWKFLCHIRNVSRSFLQRTNRHSWSWLESLCCCLTAAAWGTCLKHAALNSTILCTKKSHPGWHILNSKNSYQEVKLQKPIAKLVHFWTFLDPRTMEYVLMD